MLNGVLGVALNAGTKACKHMYIKVCRETDKTRIISLVGRLNA